MMVDSEQWLASFAPAYHSKLAWHPLPLFVSPFYSYLHSGFIGFQCDHHTPKASRYHHGLLYIGALWPTTTRLPYMIPFHPTYCRDKMLSPVVQVQLALLGISTHAEPWLGKIPTLSLVAHNENVSIHVACVSLQFCQGTRGRDTTTCPMMCPYVNGLSDNMTI